jgi:hypothetical protein
MSNRLLVFVLVQVKTVMITDPDGNHIAFAEAFDTGVAR